MTNAEARFNNSLHPRKPEGSLGRTAQDVHLDCHTAPELWPCVVGREIDERLCYSADGKDTSAVFSVEREETNVFVAGKTQNYPQSSGAV